MPGYVAGIVELLDQAGSVLELGCGTGRLAEPLGRGRRVVGIDRDPAMLEVARVRGVAVHEADFTAFELDEPAFDAALFSRNTYGLPADPVARWGALVCARRHLRPGGWIVIIQDNPATWIRRGGERSIHRAAELRDGEVVSLEEHRALDLVRWERTGWDVYRWRCGDEHRIYADPVRHGLVAAMELHAAVAAADLTIRAMWGGFDRRSLDRESALMICLAERPR